ncbi:MAG: hypothetical protein K5656_09755 [Lachnospiraceae bacterium]|nr:hypothetical protein [Lachnospiraceae bacterium]
MYSIGDVVMYKNIGVCEIVDIVEREDYDSVEKYYMLKPMNDDRSTIFVNINNKKVMMRYLLPAEEVEAIVNGIEDIDGYYCDNDRERDLHLKELINSGVTTCWVEVIKGLYDRRQERNKKGKDLSQVEERMFKTAEKLFYSEVAYTLDIPFNEVDAYINERVGHSIA